MVVPPHVKVKKSFFQWRQCKPVREVDEESKISKIYDTEANRLKFLDSTVESSDLDPKAYWSQHSL